MDSPTVLCIDDRPPTAGASQGDFRISWLSRQDRVEQLHGDEDVGRNIIGCGSTGVQRGGHRRGSRSLPVKQRFPNLPIILLSAYGEMPERILWLVDDYVMNSELPEGLVRVVERATHWRLTPAA
jgi:hypothetical protein